MFSYELFLQFLNATIYICHNNIIFKTYTPFGFALTIAYIYTRMAYSVYSALQVYINKTQAPISSFGIRHSAYTTPLIVDVMD